MGDAAAEIGGEQIAAPGRQHAFRAHQARADELDRIEIEAVAHRVAHTSVIGIAST